MAKRLTIYCKILLLALILKAPIVKGQTYFWTEDFSTSVCTKGCLLPYAGINGTWTWVSTGTNGSKANTWYISYEEEGMGRTQCGTSGADPSLHVGNVSGSPAAFLFCPGGDCGASYDASAGTDQTNAMATSPVINCTGYSTITLSFNYIMNGQTSKDYATVWYNTGSGWTLLASPAKSGTCLSGQGKWKHYTVAMLASANNNPSVQIGFNWTNNLDGIGNDPSFAVDSIQLSVPVILPIELLSFNASYNNTNDRVEVKWGTATETNNALFTIQRSTDGETYTAISTVKGAGNSSEAKYYSAIDSKLFGGTVYYKLMQTDYDGNFSYSQVVPVNEDGSVHLKVFPDPATTNITLSYYAYVAGETADIAIYDCTGRFVKQEDFSVTNKGANTHVTGISSLAKGIYLLKLTIQGKAFFAKFVKS